MRLISSSVSVSGISGEICVKYGISSLIDLSVRVCTATQYSVLAGTTEANFYLDNTSCNTLELSCFRGVEAVCLDSQLL